MEDQLGKSHYLVGDDILSIADIALYAYSHKAHMGDFDMARFPAVKAWFQRIENEAHYKEMYPDDS